MLTQPPAPGAFDAIGRTLLMADAHTWDRPTELHLLMTTPLATLTTTPLDLPDKAAHTHPATVLRAVTRTITALDHTDMPLSRDTVGVALTSEGYAAPQHRIDEIWRARTQGQPTPRFATMDGATEHRMVSMCDIHGNRYWVQHERGREDHIQFFSGTYAGPGDSGMGGEVFTALSELAATVRESLASTNTP